VKPAGPPAGEAGAKECIFSVLMAGFKVRLGDGSEIGPMDLAALRTWLSQGLIDGDSPVMRPGSRKWVPLSTISELKGAVGVARPKAKTRKKKEAELEPEAEWTDDEPTAVDRVRVKAVGAVLLLAAAALGYLAFRPSEALSAFDGAPWLEIALGALALGLALIPGWNLARRLVRVVLILAAFALFPLAGILIAQGERGAGLLALGSVWLIVSGLAALLPRRVGWAGLLVAALPVVVGGYGLYRFGRATASEAEQRLRDWSTPERRFVDDGLGLTLDAPDGWLLLKPGNPLVAAPKDARATLAIPRHGGAAYVLTEPAPRAVATADQYLDKLLERRRGERPGLEPSQRVNAIVGGLSGRQLEAAWSDQGTRYREVIVAGLDGWMGMALVAWMPEASASRPNGLDALARGFAARGVLAVRLRQAVDAAVAAVPHLSAPAAEQLMSQSEARVLEPDQAFRRSLAALAENIGSLTPAEKNELTRLTTATYAGVPWKDRARLADYVERVRKGAITPPEEDRAMAALLGSAEARLSGEGRLKLQRFYEKAILAKN
jgi:hypothetical protein